MRKWFFTGLILSLIGCDASIDERIDVSKVGNGVDKEVIANCALNHSNQIIDEVSRENKAIELVSIEFSKARNINKDLDIIDYSIDFYDTRTSKIFSVPISNFSCYSSQEAFDNAKEEKIRLAKEEHEIKERRKAQAQKDARERAEKRKIKQREYEKKIAQERRIKELEQEKKRAAEAIAKQYSIEEQKYHQKDLKKIIDKDEHEIKERRKAQAQKDAKERAEKRKIKQEKMAQERRLKEQVDACIEKAKTKAFTALKQLKGSWSSLSDDYRIEGKNIIAIYKIGYHRHQRKLERSVVCNFKE